MALRLLEVALPISASPEMDSGLFKLLWRSQYVEFSALGDRSLAWPT